MARVFFILTLGILVGCSEYNRQPTHAESDSLSGIVRLTDGFTKAGQAKLSPDLQWVIFRAIPPGEIRHQLFVARVDWKTGDTGPEPTGIERPVRITPGNSVNGSGEFSPDGFTLLFSSTGSSSDPKRMRMFQVANWQQNVALADSARGVDLTTAMPIDVPGTDFTFSPDGKWVAFSSTRDGPSRLFAMPAAGGPAVPLSNGPDSSPAFSPDGKSIAFRRDQPPTNDPKFPPGSDLFVGKLVFDNTRNITGMSDETQTTHDDNANRSPSWNADNKHIVYATSLHGRLNYDLYVMGRDGRDKTRITFSPGGNLFPTFSTDGKWISWTSTRSADGTTQVYVARFTFPPGV